MKLWNNLELTNPEFLWLLLLIPLLAVWYFFVRKKDTARLKMADTKGFAEQSLLVKLKPLLYVLRLLALTALIIAIARPRNVEVSKCFC
jgi:Ca-activated chloride channel family protein